MGAVTIDGDGLIAQGLDNKVGDNAAVVGVHVRTVSVEDAGDLDAQTVLTAVIEEKRLGAAFALIVAGAGTDGVDVAPVAFGLGVDDGVTVDLAGGGLEDLGFDPLGQAEHVDGAVHAGFGGLHGVELIVDRRGRAGQVIDLVDFDIERKGNVVAHQLEIWVIEEMGDVVLGAGEEVVETDDVVAFGEQTPAEMAAEEAGAAGDEDAFPEGVGHGSLSSV